jgi:L-malate glycosyltransferase
MSVLMVLESIFPSAGGGGAENQVRTLGRHMRGCGVEVRVLSPRLSWGPQSPTDEVDGIPVRRLTYPRLPMIGAASMLAKLAWTLWRKRHHYDAIHTHIAGNMSAVCSLMGWLLNKPVIVKLTGLTEMSGGILDADAPAGVRVRRRLLMLADAYQATSTRIGRMLVDRGFDADKVHLIPNAVDTGRFNSVERDSSLRHNLVGNARLVGIYVGRFDPEKGVELMLQGWAGAFAEHGDAALLLVGSGQLRERLEALAQQLGITKQVVFAGASEEVERYMAIADFGILASVQEGLSNTLLECMASGLPMVGSQVSGTEDFVRNGQTGWIFPPGDLPALTGCLERMRDASGEELRRMGEQARREVGNRASIDAVVTNLLQAYRRPVAAG